MKFITKCLYQGNVEDAKLIVKSKKSDIKIIMFLGLTMPSYLEDTENVFVIHIPIRDENFNKSTDKMFLAMSILETLIKNNDANVIVVCDAGLSRSPMLCLLYLVNEEFTWEEAETLLKQIIPEFQPETGLYLNIKNRIDNLIKKINVDNSKGMIT